QHLDDQEWKKLRDTNACFCCRKPGHFSHDCPDKQKKPFKRCFQARVVEVGEEEKEEPRDVGKEIRNLLQDMAEDNRWEVVQIVREEFAKLGTPSLCIQIELIRRNQTATTEALIDSGATGNLISYEYTVKKQMGLQKLPT
ncbi:hypothetical protein JAAARDRAFT_127675, partial [Jaapia argillacea MUCL 33604]